MAGKSKKKKKAAKKPRARSQKPRAKKPKANRRKLSRAACGGPKAKLVWHVFNFGERFELPAGMKVCQKGPLQFLKLPVAGDPYDNESHILLEQWSMLDREDNTLVLEAVLIRLWKHAGRWSRKYRGYLLNEHYRPSTTAQIARIVKLNISPTARALKVLKKYNLIERVVMPDFGAVADEPQDETDEPQKDAQGAKGEGQKSTKTDVDGGGAGAEKGAAPPSSLDLDKLYDRDGVDFADQVFVRIFERAANPDKLVDRRELAAFAGAWNRALIARLKPGKLDSLWEKSMKTAETRRVKKGDKPGAVWMKIFNGRLVGMTPEK